MSKIERIKAEKDGLDVYPELMRAAREGWETLSDGDVARLKWYGLYPHNSHDGHFMLRIKVVQGILSAEQAETIAGIAHEFGRGFLDCTTRQCVQIHWITLDRIPEIYARLDRVNLTVKATPPRRRSTTTSSATGSTRTCRASTRSRSPAAARTARAA